MRLGVGGLFARVFATFLRMGIRATGAEYHPDPRVAALQIGPMGVVLYVWLLASKFEDRANLRRMGSGSRVRRSRVMSGSVLVTRAERSRSDHVGGGAVCVAAGVEI